MLISVQSRFRTELIDITAQVRTAVQDLGTDVGICMVYVPHTTAAVTINESADPDVAKDILMALNKMVPWHDDYDHLEGNSPAHIKTTLVGSSELIAVEKGQLVLGTWQGIFFCEFDGPRKRKIHISIINQ